MPAYLDAYAEPESREPHLPGEGSFGHVVVVPACGEGENLERLLDSVPPGPLGTVLVVIVVNARDDHGADVHEANAIMLRRLAARAAGERTGRMRLLVIDRASPGRRLPAKQGVGLARKIGHDVALALHRAGRIRSRFQQATDADARLPADGFARLAPYEAPADPPAALLFPYVHLPEPDPATAAAITLYDAWLRYHHLGLIHAGSPYAYWSIGSTIVVEASAYAVVRGFPKTMAGEDFYLLDKLAKSGWIERMDGAPIRLAGRPSDRVPFGTGRSVRTILAEGWTAANFRVLNPRGYAALGAWLGALEDLPTGAVTRPELFGRVEACAGQSGLTGDETGALLRALAGIGALDSAVDSLALRLTPANRRRRLQTNFDAFRTLKLLHALRDDGIPAVSLGEAVTTADFLDGACVGQGDVTGWRGALEEAEARRGRGATGLVRPP